MLLFLRVAYSQCLPDKGCPKGKLNTYRDRIQKLGKKSMTKNVFMKYKEIHLVSKIDETKYIHVTILFKGYKNEQ